MKDDYSTTPEKDVKKSIITDCKIKVEQKIVTRAFADRLLTVGKYDKQRQIREPHVNQLIAEMEQGRFLRGIPIQICQLPDGKYFVVNGQQTLEAIKIVDIPITLTFITYYVKTMAEVGAIYSRLDIGRPRTAYDRLLALGIPDSILKGDRSLLKSETNSLTAAIKMLLMEFRPYNAKTMDPGINRSADLWATVITTEWKPAIQRMYDVLQFCDTRRARQRFLKAGVASVCLATIRAQGDKAYDFWALAMADDGVRARHPAHQLSLWVNDRDHLKGGSNRQILVAKHVTSCWNKYWDDGEMQSVRATDVRRLGVTIKGTPFTSSERGWKK